MDSEELAKNLSGQDAVLSALGSPGIQWATITFYQDSMKSVVEAMRKAGLKRLLCVTAFYTKSINCSKKKS
jgi:putative NADH-flavin reductase